ncbi:hypothetical protein HDU97_004753 [Phlyctochytrium planicorne]|nr:hypothetical protein HDU97_004753 [Phlyctochytrium planicorne]
MKSPALRLAHYAGLHLRGGNFWDDGFNLLAIQNNTEMVNILMDHGIRPPRSALQFAAEHGGEACMKVYIDRLFYGLSVKTNGHWPPAFLSTTDKKNLAERLADLRASFLRVARLGYTDMVKMLYALLHHNQDAIDSVMSENHEWISPTCAQDFLQCVCVASKMGHVNVVRALLFPDDHEGVDPSQTNLLHPLRWTPFHFATFPSTANLVEASVVAGNDVEASKKIEVMTCLLEANRGRKTSLDTKDGTGLTPLCWAAGSGSLDMVKLLVENGASIMIPHNFASNGEGGNGDTGEDRHSCGGILDSVPLARAISRGHQEVADYLLERLVLSSPFDAEIPLRLLCSSSDDAIMLRGHKKQLLIELCQSPDARDGNTLLHRICSRNAPLGVSGFSFMLAMLSGSDKMRWAGLLFSTPNRLGITPFRLLCENVTAYFKHAERIRDLMKCKT